MRQKEDLETVLANLELLARRQDFETESLLSRSVDQDTTGEDEDLLGWVNQLDEHISEVEENLQDLTQRIDQVEDAVGGDDDGQITELRDTVQKLDDKVEDLPDDIPHHLAELREQVTALEEYIEDVDEYATSVDNELEALRQRTSEREEQKSSETVDEEDDVDEETTAEESVEGRFTEEEIMEMSRDKRAERVRPVIREKQPVDFEAICNEILGYKPDWDKPAYKALHNAIQTFRDELLTEKDGRSSLYAFSEEAFEDSPEQEDTEDRERTEDSSESEDDVDEEEEEETESEGSYSIDVFQNLDTDNRAKLIKDVIEKNQPISVEEISEELFGHKADSGSKEYQEIHNRLAWTLEDEITKEDGLYEIAERDDGETEGEGHQDSTVSSKPESETVTEVREDNSPETQISEEAEPSEPEESSDSDRPDFSDNGGRYSLEELRNDEDLSVEAGVLKVFQEYRKDCDAISIPEATQVLFGSEASENEEEYQVVWNQLEEHALKDGERVKEIKEDGETLYEVYGPFKYCNLYYDTHHDVICTECPLEEAVYTSREAKKHHINTRNDGMKEHHNSFISAQIPDNFQNGETVHTIIKRECGKQ